MRSTLSRLGLLALLCLALLGRQAAAQEANEERGGGTTILSFDTMTGNPGKGDPANVIRGLNGGGAPWAILRSAHGVLRSNGQLIVIVRGLVVAGLDSNPVPQFRAGVSCQDPADPNSGVLFFTNLATATTGKGAGDANIIGRVQLPAHCLAPVVLITSPPSDTSPDGVWFAATGF